MYVKIQKGNSNSYMMVESKAQVTLNQRVPVFDELWDYMCQQQASSGRCGDDSNNANQSADVLHKLGVGLGQPFLIINEVDRVFWYGSPERPEFKGIELSIAHVNVDGVSYLTEGKVYILNENGQTIQKV